MSRIDGFIVVRRDGTLLRSRGSSPKFFTSRHVATQRATREGDSVVPVSVDLEAVTPVFIRTKVIP